MANGIWWWAVILAPFLPYHFRLKNIKFWNSAMKFYLSIFRLNDVTRPYLWEIKYSEKFENVVVPKLLITI